MNKALAPQVSVTESNPFYGMKGSLNLLQNASKMTDSASESVVNSLLDEGWKEANTLTKRQMFWSVVMSLGDINNREHNIFRKKGMKKVDQGGQSLRKVFLHVLKWMHRKVPEQFYSFLPVLGEYYNLGAATMHYILWTDRFKGNITDKYVVNVDVDRLTTFIAETLQKAAPHELKLWAKWLWHVPTPRSIRKFTVTEKGLKSVRAKYGAHYNVGDVVSRKAEKQAETKKKDAHTFTCIKLLCDKMDWKVDNSKGFTLYTDYKAWRKSLLSDTEAHLFSSKKIQAFDSIQFKTWLDTLASGARYNVQRRLIESKNNVLTSKKRWFNFNGEDMGKLYIQWVNEKAAAQEQLRSLSDEDKAQLEPKALKDLKKAAKVNTGATTLLDNLVEFFKGGADAEIQIQSVMDKIKLDAPILPIIDTSSSMRSGYNIHKGMSIQPYQMACMAATAFMLKNPSADAKDVLVTFSSESRFLVAGETTKTSGTGRFGMGGGQTVKIDKLVDPKLSFMNNYNSIMRFVNPTGATTFHKVAELFNNWANEAGPEVFNSRKEMILNFPIMLVVSDGDMNGMGDAAHCVAGFQQNMRQWFGWEGVVVIWDVNQRLENSANKFEGLSNVIYFGGCNPGILNQVLLNIGDIQPIDVYTPLQSMYESNRYQPVRELVK